MSTVILKLFVFLSKCSILSRIIVLFDLFFALFFIFFRLFPQFPLRVYAPLAPLSRAKYTRKREFSGKKRKSFRKKGGHLRGAALPFGVSSFICKDALFGHSFLKCKIFVNMQKRQKKSPENASSGRFSSCGVNQCPSDRTASSGRRNSSASCSTEGWRASAT